jgi:hypothetical protein
VEFSRCPQGIELEEGLHGTHKLESELSRVAESARQAEERTTAIQAQLESTECLLNEQYAVVRCTTRSSEYTLVYLLLRTGTLPGS